MKNLFYIECGIVILLTLITALYFMSFKTLHRSDLVWLSFYLYSFFSFWWLMISVYSLMIKDKYIKVSMVVKIGIIIANIILLLDALEELSPYFLHIRSISNLHIVLIFLLILIPCLISIHWLKIVNNAAKLVSIK